MSRPKKVRFVEKEPGNGATGLNPAFFVRFHRNLTGTG